MGFQPPRWVTFIAIALNCIAGGSIQLFSLVSVPFQTGLNLSSSQLATIASFQLGGQYLAGTLLGGLVDKKGPGVVSALGALFFGGAYLLLGAFYAYYNTNELEVNTFEWFLLCLLFLTTGAGTAASYFSGLIASTKSFPSRHSGLAIGIPCSIFGLSPLFLSPFASYFTDSETHELDPTGWLLFLGCSLAAVNIFGAFCIKIHPWDESEHENASINPTTRVDQNDATEHTPLLPSSISNYEESLKTDSNVFTNPTFWLMGLVLMCATGPCEMTMASFGGLVGSMLGVQIQAPDARGLVIRKLQVQILSVANTLSRLFMGGISDWLSFSTDDRTRSELQISELEFENTRQSLPARIRQTFRRPPKISRLLFLFSATLLLAAVFLYTSFMLDQSNQLWILSTGVGISYGTIFTLAPAVVRTVYPVEDFGRNWGVLNWFSAAGAMLFTPLFGFFADRAAARQESPICYGPDCWKTVYTVSATSALLSTAIILILWRGPWRGKV